MTLHRDIAAGNIHVPYQWSYADATARTSATGFVSGDVGKLALQLDDHSLWLLSATAPTWVEVGAGASGAVSSVNTQTGAVVLDADDISDSATTNKWTTAANLTKLAGIEAGAEVTSTAKVSAAGAVMTSATDASGFGFVIDEDAMTSDLATKVPTQQSVKAYVDAAVIGAGSYTDEKAQDAVGAILTDSSSIDFTYDDVGNSITAAAVFGTTAGSVAEGNHTHAAGYTDEMARDAIGAALVAGSNVAITVNDGADTITIGSTWQTIALTWVIDEGAVPATGAKAWLVVPCACQISEHYLLADQAGSLVLDVWKDSYANYPPTVADTITASAKPTLSAAAKAHDATLTGWSKSLAAGDVIGINVDSVSTITKFTFALLATRTA